MILRARVRDLSGREVASETALQYCLAALKSYHTTRPGITTLIRNTEKIMQAGEYKPNDQGHGLSPAKEEQQ